MLITRNFLIITTLAMSSNAYCGEAIIEGEENAPQKSVLRHIGEGSIHLIKGAGHATLAAVEIMKSENTPVQRALSVGQNIDHIEEAAEETTLAGESTYKAFKKSQCVIF
jgi:hypothetical protein